MPDNATSTTATPIDELVALLDSYAPEELKELRALYPNDKPRLEATKVLGASEIPIPLAVDTCLRGMRTTLEVCRKQTPPVSKKLTQAKRLQNIGRIVSVIGSTSLFALLATKYEAAKYMASAMAFIGNLLPEIAGAVSSTLHAEEKNLFEYHQKLISFESDAASIYDELTLCKRAGYVENCASGDTRELIRKGNAISYNVRTLLRKQGLASV